MDLERLDEAIKRWPSASLDEINAEGGVGDVIFEAAIKYRDCLASGKAMWAEGTGGTGYSTEQVVRGVMAMLSETGLLVPPTEED